MTKSTIREDSPAKQPEQMDLDPEIAQLVNENFEDLLFKDEQPEDLRAAHHRERKARNAREWRAKHPEAAKLRDKLYHEKYKQKRTEDAKKYYEEHKNDANFVELRKARSIKYYYANPTKARARSIVGKAVSRGKLAKPTICSSCAMEKPIEGHHPDYSKPLEVVWLCKNCHESLHHGGQAIATAQANIHSVFGGTGK